MKTRRTFIIETFSPAIGDITGYLVRATTGTDRKRSHATKRGVSLDPRNMSNYWRHVPIFTCSQFSWQ